jgi:fructokinase
VHRPAGGSPLNVAIGLARLGQPTAFAGRLSTDPLGTVLRHQLERSSVDLRYVVYADQPSTVALVDLASGHARYQFSEHGPDFCWSPAELSFVPAGARAVHFGSLASWLPPGDGAIAAAITALRQSGSVLISYDPNIRPALQPDQRAARAQAEESVGLAHLVKASADDLRWLYGDDAQETVAGRWLDLGPELVVVTAGGDGATGWTRGRRRCGGRPPRQCSPIRSAPATPS